MRVLIADDDRIAAEMLARQLESLGYDVVTSGDGQEAWEEYQRESFSFVIMDWLMPRMDGLELLRNIRSSPASPYVYCILLTVKDHLNDLIKGMDAGADDFLTKPFDPNELRVRLGAGKRIVELERRLRDSNNRMKQDLLAAASIQRSLLPLNLPEFAGFRFAWKYRPCDELGGDILNVIPLSQHQVAFYLLDVAGHGVSAALLSVAFSRLLTTATNASSMIRDKSDSPAGYRVVEPSAVLSRLNERFCPDLSEGRFFTILYGVLDVRSRQLCYASGGHNPAFLLGNDGSIGELESTGTIVGFFEDESYGQTTVELNPQDRLLVYSDGVIDAMNSAGERLGHDRLLEFLKSAGDLPIHALLDGLVQRVDEWAHPTGLEDDVSCLIAEAL